MRLKKRLTHAALESLRKKPVAGKYFTGDDGLYLRVSATGGASWQWRYRYGGKENTATYGKYPEVTMADARERHQSARALFRAGSDPNREKKKLKTSIAARSEKTFKKVAEGYLEGLRKTGRVASYTQKIEGSFKLHVYPVIGNEDIDEIDGAVILSMLRKIEDKGKNETAQRVLTWCGAAFKYANHMGFTQRNPADGVSNYLAKPEVKHMAALLEPEKVAEFLRASYQYNGKHVVCAALRLLPLVMLRPGELRHGTWDEIDLEAGMWTIPAQRMKGVQAAKKGKPHLVPLAPQAVEILRRLKAITGGVGLIFPGDRSDKRPMSDAAINRAIQGMGYSTQSEVTAHGFRATARTLLVERLDCRTEAVEAQLAHAVKDSLGTAYNRTEFLEYRKQMMVKWADYLDRLRIGGEVIPIQQSAARVA